MIKLISEINDFLKNVDFEWSICGGYAIDLFCDKQTRIHNDIDICVFWENRNNVIEYMRDLEWTVYEACGGGIVHLITDLSQQKYIKNNIFCVKDSNKFFHVKSNGNNMFTCEIDHVEQTELDYIEILFNRRNGKYFIYSRNENVKREIKKAVLNYNDIPYLAPEIILLYKTTSPADERYEHDFMAAMAKMNNESKAWLLSSLNLCYPDGHIWSRRIV